MARPLLALFDVDGTLFLTDDPLSSEALLETLRELYPASPTDDAVERVDHEGQTAKRIARLVLRAQGLDDAAVDERLDEWCARFAARYCELVERADPAGWEAARGAKEALERLREAQVRLALLTGNPESMARTRMTRLGLDRFFEAGQGAFGCDGEERAALIGLARRRAGDWPPGRTVEIGDTAGDAAGARTAGVRSILIRPPGTTAPGAGGAVCENLRDAADLLLAWNGRP